jgi:hypothetical protein
MAQSRCTQVDRAGEGRRRQVGDEIGNGHAAMGRLFLYLVVLLLLAGLGGSVYALFADLPPPTRSVDIELPAASLD